MKNDLTRLCDEFNATRPIVTASFVFNHGNLGPGILLSGEMAGYVYAELFWEPTMDDLREGADRICKVLQEAAR